MDELNDFFKNLNAPRIELRAPATSGFRVMSTEHFQTTNLALNRREKTIEDDSTDYAEVYRQKDEEEYLDEPQSTEYQRGDYMEDLSSMGDLNSRDQLLSESDLLTAYNKYSFRRPYNTLKLPIESVREKVLSALENHSVVIIEGATGCGKTTQVPQWILDDCYERRRHCKIAVTQPRRIAAISIAKRVAQERGWEVGGVVGYQVGLDSKITEDTHLHYMTTGILLQKLVAAKNLNMYTHIILDEIHERGQEMDFLLLVVKKLLRKNSRNVKVLLMSATFDSAKFQEYFHILGTPGLKGTDYINVDAKTPFTNSIYYLDQLKQFRNLPRVTWEEPTVSPQGNELVLRLLAEFEKIDAGEDVHESNKVPPSVLIFLPGINEIEEMANCLEDPVYRRKILEKECALKWHVVPLHSTITSQEQARAFQPPPEGHRKVILATNIAESSITVPDIKYVIDFCLMKVLVSDPDTHFTSLQTQWAARTNCTQRAGRAGRVRAGRVYRLVTKAMYKSQFEENCAPEMERCPLERLVLLAKMLDMGPPKEILALAMNPPKLGNIRTTVLVLKEVGGLLKTLNGEMSYEDGDITYLGRVMAKLPVDIRVAKLIVLGHIFGALYPTIVMGAAMTVKNVFNTPFRERLNAYNSKLTWADGSRSDCIAFYNLYKVWSNKVRTGSITKANERAWARDMYAQVRALKELDDMVRELSCRLRRMDIESVKNAKPAWSQAEMPLILKVLITGAFYPHYFVQPAGTEIREREAFRVLGGHDACNTVYLKDFPADQPPELYTAAIKKAVRDLITDEPRVTFDTNSRKVYLTFASSGEMNENRSCRMPGRVALPVYKAVKARQLNLDIIIPSMPAERAHELAEGLRQEQPTRLPLRLPDITDSFMMLVVSHVIDPGHFWVQNDSDLGDLDSLNKELQRPELLTLTEEVHEGMVCLAPYMDQETCKTVYCRAVVHRVMPGKMVWVLFMDYGNYAKVGISSLRETPPGRCSTLRPLAIECVLTGVGPALCKGDTIWSQEANQLFLHYTRQKLLGKIYSVAHGVVSLELRTIDGSVCINNELISHGLARRTEESYDSMLNHDLRETAQELSQRQLVALSEQQAQQAGSGLHRDATLHPGEFTHTIRLKGAFSPLESSLQNLMSGGSGKQVSIEWNSVNSVLLDTEPQEPYQRLVVAGLIGQNSEGSKLTLRHTTMMPNMAGLPAIMAMLFAPSVELKLDETHSRYVAVLCGLGAHRTRDAQLKPIFPDHDLLMHFDVELTNADLQEINHLRFIMNQMMWCPAGQDEPAVPPELAEQAPTLARRDIISLLMKHRRHREFVAVSQQWRWSRSTVAPPSASEEVANAIYPPHGTVRLEQEDLNLIQRKLDEDTKFHEMIKRNITDRCRTEVVCSLCGVGPMDLVSLRLHLRSRKHQETVDELRAKITPPV